jgi:alpha-amylase/alpha-mannosidase (GH57 family)
MSHDRRLNLVLCWHMHQPDYRDPRSGEYQSPWTYLHAIKDYVDMVEHVERTPGARAVFNFTPILLEQLDDYARQLTGHLRNGQPLSDPLLAALAAPEFPDQEEARLALVKNCLRANRKRLVEPFAPFQRLVRIAERMVTETGGARFLSDHFLAELVTWYHLVWLGEIARRFDPDVKALLEQGTGFTFAQRRRLLGIITEQIASIGVRYGKLADAGRIELCMSPWGHPILPLLLDLGVTREAMPGAPLPNLAAYPGGLERSRWHIEHGLRSFERYFGRRPVGCWPSEGSVSTATLALLADTGFQWVATGEGVLRNSVRAAGIHADHPDLGYSPWRLPGSPLKLFARNDLLSDRIGFTYLDWHADDAVGDLIHRIEQIARHCTLETTPVLSIILDGENAWEHYPNNGYYLLSALYRRLSEHPFIRLTTYSEILAETPARELPRIVAGSWVYGTFSTWIGSPDKNRAWDMLGEAKHAFDARIARGHLDKKEREALEHQLAKCESSDWFWWLGDYNPAASVGAFERLYRLNLACLHELAGSTPPENLGQVLSHGNDTTQQAGTMRASTPTGGGP